MSLVQLYGNPVSMERKWGALGSRKRKKSRRKAVKKTMARRKRGRKRSHAKRVVRHTRRTRRTSRRHKSRKVTRMTLYTNPRRKGGRRRSSGGFRGIGSGILSPLTSNLKPIGLGIVGFIGTDYLVTMIPYLKDQTSPEMKLVSKLVVALGGGYLISRFVSQEIGKAVVVGALFNVGLSAVQNYAGSMLPANSILKASAPTAVLPGTSGFTRPMQVNGFSQPSQSLGKFGKPRYAIS